MNYIIPNAVMSVADQLAAWNKVIGEEDAPYPAEFIEFKSEPDENICGSCGGQMQIVENELECAKCGLKTKNTGNISYSSENNVFGETMINFRYEGASALKKNKLNYRTCSNSAVHGKNLDRKLLMHNNFIIENKRIPKSVIDKVIDDYAKIKEDGHVYRGDGKKGVLSALIYYRCHEAGIARTPRDIISFMKIPQKKHSEGDRKIQRLKEKKVLDLPIRINSFTMHVKQYFALLGIEKKYMAFVLDLIKRAEDKKIHITNESKTTTKCVGAIYMLITRLKLKISNDDISAKCNISKSTFVKYYKLLCAKYYLIKKPFKAHGIPMPKDWKYVPEKYIKTDKLC